jgi:hypothetical protein
VKEVQHMTAAQAKIRVYDGLWEQGERKKTENDGSGINMEGQEL